MTALGSRAGLSSSAMATPPSAAAPGTQGRGLLRRRLRLAAGVLWLMLGTVAIVLPLLPTVGCYGLAAFCVERGNRRWKAWWLVHPRLGPAIVAWRRSRAVPLSLSPRRFERIAALMCGAVGLSFNETKKPLIRIDDDGRGIQRDKVLQRAWDRGLVEPGVRPADADIDRLIFEPGFSTAEKVTNLSGRVGMDVVRRNIEALRGTVSLWSEPGQGSRIDIRLPLTLAIIDGFLVGVGPSKFIFPLDAVVEVIEDRDATHSVDALGRRLVELRGHVLPVVGLRTLYGLESDEPERASVVVIQSAGRRYGVLVDQLLGQHQTVIKPLGRMFRSLRGMAGSSILGNGEVALIFDVNSLGELAAIDAAAPSRATTRSAAASSTASTGAPQC